MVVGVGSWAQPNMQNDEQHKRGNLAVVRGGQYGKRVSGRRTRTAEEFRLDRLMQEAFAAIYGESGTVPSKGIYDVREGHRQPWRTLARRIREAHANGAPLQSVRAPLLTFLKWVERDLYRHDGDCAA